MPRSTTVPENGTTTTPKAHKQVRRTETEKFVAATRAARRDDTGCLTASRKRNAEVSANPKPINMEYSGVAKANSWLTLELATMQKVATSATATAFAWMTALSLTSGREESRESSGAMVKRCYEGVRKEL